MIRVKRGLTARTRHKRILQNTSGYYSRSNNVLSVARQRLEKAKQYQYIHRHHLKRNIKRYWVMEINNILRNFNLQLNYSKFKNFTRTQKTILNSKLNYLVSLAEYSSFAHILNQFYLSKLLRNMF